jgi:hypothetical protein
LNDSPQHSQPAPSASEPDFAPLGVPVCITGMHRSGTSLVAGILAASGLYLGPDEQLAEAQADNPDGFFENSRVLEINEAVLAAFGSAWDRPLSMPAGWASDERLNPLFHRASSLAYQLAKKRGWGFKDPRNCLTLPFWRRVAPGLKVIVCVRSPLEVAASLHERNGFSEIASFALWLAYNQAALDNSEGTAVAITHYDTWFESPDRELRRLRSFLGLESSEDQTAALATIRPGLRHSRTTFEDLEAVRPAAEVVALYRDLAMRAGVAEASSWEVPAGRSNALVSRDALQARHVTRNLDALRRAAPDSTFGPGENNRLRRLRRENDQITNALRYFESRIEELEKEVEHARAERDWQAADRDHVAALLAARSEELQAAVASLAGLRSQLDDALTRVSAAETSLAAVDKSRLVRLQRRYWRMLSGLRRR